MVGKDITGRMLNTKRTGWATRLLRSLSAGSDDVWHGAGNEVEARLWAWVHEVVGVSQRKESSGDWGHPSSGSWGLCCGASPLVGAAPQVLELVCFILLPPTGCWPPWDQVKSPPTSIYVWPQTCRVKNSSYEFVQKIFMAGPDLLYRLRICKVYLPCRQRQHGPARLSPGGQWPSGVFLEGHCFLPPS